ncbi:DEAD/DEAH box helicase [Nocardioides sp. Y6]|uniref:DEAD/DEAH box helicase n=1 Tax=Nocardioides malaquae TaxID=2773426 RepID=A0ABR9RSH6_9ACTN|nr:DEAD/DEAH box helicase [Nocardioides malaquae]MBE7324105.1 DEAD/DEAH box helicase [Nocardioides malaquae]
MRGVTISDAALFAAFDPGSVMRGRAYAAARRVLTLQVDDSEEGTLQAVGLVSGARQLPYRVEVRVDERGITGRCDCPVATNCKHAVAVLQEVRSRRSLRPVVAIPEWRRSLDAVLEPLEKASPPPATRRRLALQFEIPVPTRRPYRSHVEPGQRLWLRPMREGARDNWIKTGITWASAETPHHDEAHDLEQLAVLHRIVRALPGSAPRDVIDLTTIGPQWWSLLLEAQEAGIELLGGERVSSVELGESVEAVVDVVDTADGTRLRVGVEHEGRFVTGDDLLLLGRQPHSAAILSPTRPHSGARYPKLRLVLAPLRRRLPESVVRLRERRGVLEVPAADRAAFESDYLPRLRQQLPVTSSDGSVELPAEVPPRLEALVAWQGTTVEVVWRWRYDETVFVLGSDERAPALRRPHLERDLLAAVAGWADLQPERTFSGSRALEFVTDDLPLLVADEHVDVVETGVRPDFREAVAAPTIEFVAPEEEPEASTDWLDLRVVIDVEGEQVPLTDLLEALTVGEPRLVLSSGLHLATDRPEFRRLAELVAAASQIRDGRGDELRVGERDLGMWAELAELGVVDTQAARWVEAAQALIGHETLPHVDPVGLVSTPRPYQLDGIRWLVHLWQLGLGGILADDMGLGKTLQTLATISHARAHGAAPFLVVAPTSVVSAWASEAARHTPGLTVRVVEASGARRTQPLADVVRGADVVVTSYTLFRLDADAYTDLEWGGLVLDEAQAIKNHQSKTYQAIRRLDAPFRLAVTGTPFENRLMEMWALLSVVAPGLYPWPTAFQEQVVAPVEKRGDTEALERFRRRVRPFVLRRTKDLVAADLPPKQEQVLTVPLGPEHQRLYDTWLQRERQAILGLVDDFDGNRMAIFSALTRLRQLSLDPALIDEEHEAVGSAKLDVLVDHLVELAAEGHRALVFSQFTSFLKRARRRLEAEGLTVRYLDGATRRRGEEIEAFKSGEGDAFLISLKAGGVGLTLTEADYVFVLDPWWNPAAENQAVDRAHRIGQERHVMVYRMVSAGTIEEKVMALKQRKADLFASVFSGEGAVGGGIDAEDVRALFS